MRIIFVKDGVVHFVGRTPDDFPEDSIVYYMQEITPYKTECVATQIIPKDLTIGSKCFNVQRVNNISYFGSSEKFVVVEDEDDLIPYFGIDLKKWRK